MSIKLKKIKRVIIKKIFIGDITFFLKSNIVYLKSLQGEAFLNVISGVNLLKINGFENNKNILYFCYLSDFKNKRIITTFYYKLLNVIKGLISGFFDIIKLSGLGYRVKVLNNIFLFFRLGFSHNVIKKIPSNVSVFCLNNTEFVLFSTCNESLYNFTSRLIFLKKPDSYKGKGLFLKNNSLIRLKEGKKNQ